MDQTWMVLSLLALQKKCWDAGRDERDNPECEDAANTLVGLIIKMMDFPSDLTKEESDDLYEGFDDDLGTVEMFIWLHTRLAELRCRREIAACCGMDLLPDSGSGEQEHEREQDNGERN